MKNEKVEIEITAEEFENVLFNPDLIVVQKEKTFGKEEHWTWLYVFANHSDTLPIRTFARVIDINGTSYMEIV